MKRVFIVEDDADLRETLRDVFVDEGYEVFTAEAGDDALKRLHKMREPCVVILDLMIPVIDGNEVYDTMQKDAWLQAFPVIVTTSDPSQAPSGVLLMKKPIHLDRLLEAVRRAVPQAALRKAEPETV